MLSPEMRKAVGRADQRVEWNQELGFGHHFKMSKGHSSGTVKWTVR